MDEALTSSPPNEETSGTKDLLPGRSPASFKEKQDNGTTVLLLGGDWTVDSLGDVEERLKDKTSSGQGSRRGYSFDLSRIAGLDTAGALLINQYATGRGQDQPEADIRGTNDIQKALLEIAKPPKDETDDELTPGRLIVVLNAIGRFLSETGRTTLELVGFLGEFLVLLSKLVFHPARLRWTSLVFHMQQTGLKAVPIVALLTFLIGVVVAYMGSEQLQKFGAQVFAVNLLEVSIMREMGVLITAIVVAGRSSSSFTAQIGAMVANEEVAAIRSMGLDPMNLLVAPRVLALLITLPILVFIADIMAMLGGAVAINMTMGMSFQAFVDQFHAIAKVQNFLVGMVKTPFFAIIIGVVGCFQGFKATGSAESVGFLTTVAVVQSIFLVILADALFALFFTAIGI